MKRRTFLRTAGVTGAIGLAGCSTNSGNGSNETTGGNTTTTNGTTGTTTASSRTLTVATYPSYVGDKNSPGAWLKSKFEAAHDGVTVEWSTPSSGSSSVNQFVQRKKQGAPIGADVYVGLNTDELVTVDEQLDTALFANIEGDLQHSSDVKDGLKIDPKGRAVPYDTGYITPIYDATKLDTPPGSFDDFLKPALKGDLITENAQNSDTGKAFLLWSVHAKTPDGYLDYWKKLLDNDVRILSDWQPAYNAYTNGEAPIVVSYSTDPVYAAKNNENLDKYSVAFLDGEGYANPEATAVFADAKHPDLGRAFVDFMLSADAQANIPQMNYEFPATTTGKLSGTFAKYAKEPKKPVTMTYDDLKGNVGTWIDKWARLVASH